MSKVKLDVRVYPIDEPKGSTVAFANVGIADSVAISGIRVVKGAKNNFVSMPQSQDKDGNYHNYASVNNDAVRKEMEKAILAEYKSPTRDADGNNVGRTVAAETDAELTGKIEASAYPLKNPQGSTLAFANVNISDLVTINSARVIEGGEKGMFVAMPQSRDKEGNYHDIAFPINGEVRQGITENVLDAYSDKTERRQSMSDRLAEGQSEAAKHNADAPKKEAAKKSPGLGD
jgi:stage V sporulation protein G